MKHSTSMQKEAISFSEKSFNLLTKDNTITEKKKIVPSMPMCTK